MKSCILTIVKNEQEYLDEWIRYHLKLGIDHIFVFEDIDSKSHKDITDKYKDRVSLYSTFSNLNESDRNKALELKKTRKWNVQHIYLRNSLLWLKNTFADIYDWCFVIDNDEFITFEGKTNTLEDIFRLYEDYDAFTMQWECYGANGLVKKPDYKNNSLIEIYKEKASGYVPDTADSLLKTCYNIKKYKNEFFFNQHHPNNKCNWCNTNFKKDYRNPGHNNVYLRHYITRSWEEYVWKRKERGFMWGRMRDFDLFFTVNPDMNNLKAELVGNVKKEVLVVLPYKQGGSQGNEIRLALRGWKKFCQFKYRFVVIGEFDESLDTEFPWAEFIFIPQGNKIEGQYTQHINVQNCMEIINKRYDKEYDGFIWMVDDNYAIKPFELEDIMQIHYHSNSFTGDENKPTSFWQHDKWKTRQLLDREGLPCRNYTTHYPCFFEFRKLKEIWDKFGMREESYVLEDIYFNYFPHEEPILDSTIRLGIWDKRIFEREFQKAIENPDIKFVCNSVEGWSKELEDELWKIVK